MILWGGCWRRSIPDMEKTGIIFNADTSKKVRYTPLGFLVPAAYHSFNVSSNQMTMKV